MNNNKSFFKLLYYEGFALGSSLQLVENILEGKVDNGFAIIRPPGKINVLNFMQF